MVFEPCLLVQSPLPHLPPRPLGGRKKKHGPTFSINLVDMLLLDSETPQNFARNPKMIISFLFNKSVTMNNWFKQRNQRKS